MLEITLIFPSLNSFMILSLSLGVRFFASKILSSAEPEFPSVFEKTQSAVKFSLLNSEFNFVDK